MLGNVNEKLICGSLVGRGEPHLDGAPDQPVRHRVDSNRLGRVGAFRRNLQKGARLRRLAGTDTTATLYRRKAEARRNIEDGRATLRRLLIIGASAVVRHATLRGVPEGSWHGCMLARKPRLLVIVALANKMARVVWALMARGGIYRAPAVTA